jgi:hypothetical protein
MSRMLAAIATNPSRSTNKDPRASDVKQDLPPFSRLNPKTTISDDVLLFAAGNGVTAERSILLWIVCGSRPSGASGLLPYIHMT